MHCVAIFIAVEHLVKNSQGRSHDYFPHVWFTYVTSAFGISDIFFLYFLLCTAEDSRLTSVSVDLPSSNYIFSIPSTSSSPIAPSPPTSSSPPTIPAVVMTELVAIIVVEATMIVSAVKSSAIAIEIVSTVKSSAISVGELVPASSIPKPATPSPMVVMSSVVSATKSGSPPYSSSSPTSASSTSASSSSSKLLKRHQPIIFNRLHSKATIPPLSFVFWLLNDSLQSPRHTLLRILIASYPGTEASPTLELRSHTRRTSHKYISFPIYPDLCKLPLHTGNCTRQPFQELRRSLHRVDYAIYLALFYLMAVHFQEKLITALAVERALRRLLDALL